MISGRNLLDMTVHGVKYYKKALSFANHKWDCDGLVPKESGTTMDNVVLYVRRMMYRELKQKNESDSDSVVETTETEAIELHLGNREKMTMIRQLH